MFDFELRRAQHFSNVDVRKMAAQQGNTRDVEQKEFNRPKLAKSAPKADLFVGARARRVHLALQLLGAQRRLVCRGVHRLRLGRALRAQPMQFGVGVALRGGRGVGACLGGGQ